LKAGALGERGGRWLHLARLGFGEKGGRRSSLDATQRTAKSILERVTKRPGIRRPFGGIFYRENEKKETLSYLANHGHI
jgi:hypothetical protein